MSYTRTDRKFNELLKTTRSIGIGSFYYRCHQRGVIPDSIPHYETIPFPVEVLPKKVQEIVKHIIEMGAEY